VLETFNPLDPSDRDAFLKPFFLSWEQGEDFLVPFPFVGTGRRIKPFTLRLYLVNFVEMSLSGELSRR